MKVHIWKFSVNHKSGKLHHSLSLDTDDSIKAIQAFQKIVKSSNTDEGSLSQFRARKIIGCEHLGEYEHHNLKSIK